MHRYVVETPVEKQVALVRERVVVERRRPATDKVNGEALTETTVEVVETDEVPVVGKTVRLREEVVVRTERTEHVETVRGTVRRDEIEVEHANKRPARLRAPARRKPFGTGRHEGAASRPPLSVQALIADVGQASPNGAYTTARRAEESEGPLRRQSSEAASQGGPPWTS